MHLQKSRFRLLLIALCGGLLWSCVLAVAVEAKADAASKPTARAASIGQSGDIFDLTDYGAVGDGVADDGPALQSALDAIAQAGGGTLYVPAGRFAIQTPVVKDFGGTASLVILGVESLKPVPLPTAFGNELSEGLDLFSEFAPQTGESQIAIHLGGLKNFLIRDIAFIGTPDVQNDAAITLALSGIEQATIRHCEFYGLISQVWGGSIIQAFRSHLTIEQTKFLGSTGNSGVYAPVVEALEWKSITITDTIFIDYGQRPELFSKTGMAAAAAWLMVGDPAPPDIDSPRREVVIRDVFFDEGSTGGLSSLPSLYSSSAPPIDLIYVTGLYMNVANLGTQGHYLTGVRNVLVEKSHYGWSQRADSAINLMGVSHAILDEIECVEASDRIRADDATTRLTVINSIYTDLASLAQVTKVINTTSAEEDPVQYVRQQFNAVLGRVPDAAAHFYWSDQLLLCDTDATCLAERRAALAAYLNSAPQPKFTLSGRLVSEQGTGIAGATVTLGGSQSVATVTDSEGRYRFSNLPTSGAYTVSPTLPHETFSPLSDTIVTPAGDRTANFTATFNRHDIEGRVTDSTGAAMSGVTVKVSGSQSATTTTDSLGRYSFSGLPAGGSYTVTPSRTSYKFTPGAQTFDDLNSDLTLDFSAEFVTYTINGNIRVAGSAAPLGGVTVTLSGAVSRTTTTDSGGSFSFTGLPSEGNYTVTPALPHYSFSLPSQTFNSLASDQFAGFTGTYATHKISGRVTSAGGAGISGALVTLSGSTSGSVSTDADGNYALSLLPTGGNYTVSVSRANYTFAQPTQTFSNLTTDRTADFGGVVVNYTVAGRVTEKGAGLAGVVVTLGGSQSAQKTTDAAGNYSFSLPAEGDYTLTASKATYEFSPPSAVIEKLGENRTHDFTASLSRYKLTGRIVKANNTGIPGILVTLSGASSATTTTDAGGNYSFSGLQHGSTYTVTPTLRHHSFSPPSRTLNEISSDQEAFFGVTPNTHSISGRVTGAGGGALSGATLSLVGGPLTLTAISDTSGNYSFRNLTAGRNYSVSVSRNHYTFAPPSAVFNDLGSDRTADFAGTPVNYTIGGRVTEKGGSGVAGVTVTLSGSRAATATTDAAGNYSFSLPAEGSYTLTPSKTAHTFDPPSLVFNRLSGHQPSANFATTILSFIEFSAASFEVWEGGGAFEIAVKRSGDTSIPASVTYSAEDGTSRQGVDLNTLVGRLTFAPGETSKLINIFVTDDAFVEDIERVTLKLGDVSGATLGDRSTAILRVADNDQSHINVNPNDDARFFVRQHYIDFFGREPDASGLDHWTKQITECGSDANCLSLRRQNGSAAFFLSIEFQETGFLVHRLYQTAHGRMPRRVEEFLLDARDIGAGVVVGDPGWREKLEANKDSHIAAFVKRAAFVERYPLSLTPEQFVAALNANTGGSLTAAEEAALAATAFGGAADSSSVPARRTALRSVAENAAFSRRETNRAFVLMQYFGYLQRNPDEAPDTDFRGFDHWLKKLDDHDGNFVQAQMVLAFIDSIEYRKRFGP